MKKLYIIPLIITIIAIPILFLCGCKEGKEPSPVVTDTTTDYKMTVTFNSELTEAAIAESVTWFNTSENDISTIVFYLYPNAYLENAANPAYFAGLDRYGSLTVAEVTSGDKSLSYSLSDSKTIMSVELAEPLAGGNGITLSLISNLCIPKSTMRLGTAGSVTNMTNFYPIVSVYENGNWRMDEFYKVGDPFYSECSDYEVNIECPTDVIVACGADETSEVSTSYMKTVTAKSTMARDFAFAASRKFKMLTTTANDVEIRYFYTDKSAPESSLDTAAKAIEVLSGTIGSYDGKVLSIVDTEYYYGGMEYPKLVFINKNAVAKQDIIAHEIAHQWFSCAVGSDSINNSWQDEALVTFLGNYYFAGAGDGAKYAALVSADRATYNAYLRSQKSAGEAVPGMQQSIYDFPTNYEYSMVEYTRGSLMFDAIYQLAGEDKFTAALAKYYSNCLHKNASPEDLFDAFSTCGIDAAKICNAWLTGAVVTASF